MSWFMNVFDARHKVARWRKEYNHQRRHNGLGCQTPIDVAGPPELWPQDARFAYLENATRVFHFATALKTK